VAPLRELVACAGSGRIAGRSIASKTDRRHSSSFWKGRALSLSSSSAIPSLSAARLKNGSDPLEAPRFDRASVRRSAARVPSAGLLAELRSRA
jgi:hypothetical protein